MLQVNILPPELPLLRFAVMCIHARAAAAFERVAGCVAGRSRTTNLGKVANAMVLRHAQEPMTPAQLVDALRERFGAVIDAASPARLVSTRMSTLASVESTEDGWRLVLSGIGLESEAYE